MQSGRVDCGRRMSRVYVIGRGVWRDGGSSTILTSLNALTQARKLLSVYLLIGNLPVAVGED